MQPKFKAYRSNFMGHTRRKFRVLKEVKSVKGTDILEAIKRRLIEMTGEKVYITANHGRRKRSSLTGILEGTYRSIFTVLIPGNPPARLSFTYSDVLTRAVIIQTAKDKDESAAIS